MLSTDDVLSDILKKERENAMKHNFNLKFDVKHLLLVNWNIETCIHAKMKFVLSKSKSERETIGSNADTVLNDFYGLGKQKYLNNV